jgi:hypothetical protein
MLTTLRRAAHLRSGDKGDTACISVIAYDEQLYPVLVEQVSAAAVVMRYGAAVKGAVTRYEVPGIAALNFTLAGALGGGVSRNLAIDVYGKSLCSALLDLPILVPVELAHLLVGEEDFSRQLVGTWSLFDYRRVEDGRVVYPFGPDALGWIQYGADRRMSATLCRAARPKMAQPVRDDWSGDPGEWAQAAASYLAYTGTWRLQGQSIVHTVDACSYPNWVGRDLVRQVIFSGAAHDPMLKLTTSPAEIGPAATMTSELTWRRWAGPA